MLALMILAWMIPALAAFRRLGYESPTLAVRQKHCDWSTICEACRCRHCRGSLDDHKRRWACDNYEAIRPHYDRVAAAGILSLLFWPVIVGVFGYKVVCAKYDLNPSFFKPAPKIETKTEKELRRQADRDKALKKAERELLDANRKLKELGISVEEG